MGAAKLTQAEAKKLLEMLKCSLIAEIEFPTSKRFVKGFSP